LTSIAASLRTFARVDDPSEDLLEYLSVKEGVESALECWVDLATPRDFEWTDEIREKTVEFGLADDDGEVLATFATLEEAEAAKGRVRVKFALEFEDDEPAPRKKGAPKIADPLRTETQTSTGATSIVGTAAGL